MKKINLIALVLMLMVSCQKDDETTVPQCEQPINLSTSNLTHNTATIQWESNNAGPENSFKIEYGVSGFSLGSGSVLTSASNTLTISNLNPNTSYEFYVQAICSANNTSLVSGPNSFTTVAPPVATEFRQNLSEMNLFQGNLSDLQPSSYTFEYKLSTSLYTDYALKQRIIALPQDTTLEYNGDGLPNFPDNTVIAKTFYYNEDDGNPSLGQIIIETRVMIKINGTWEFGNYVWNDNQSEAILDNNGSVTPISWIDAEGNTRNANYEIPSAQDCFTCHQSFGNSTLIGPKLRTMNFDINGVNQLQTMINNGHLTNVTDVSTISSLPNWEDTSISPERRVRAYFDVNCAHCHMPGGYHTEMFFNALNLAYETPFDETQISNQSQSILPRIQTSIDEYSMPYIGVTFPHQEALDLIVPYLESLD